MDWKPQHFSARLLQQFLSESLVDLHPYVFAKTITSYGNSNSVSGASEPRNKTPSGPFNQRSFVLILSRRELDHAIQFTRATSME